MRARPNKSEDSDGSDNDDSDGGSTGGGGGGGGPRAKAARAEAPSRWCLLCPAWVRPRTVLAKLLYWDLCCFGAVSGVGALHVVALAYAEAAQHHVS